MSPQELPDLAALDRFLVGSPPLAQDGRVLSWLGPDAYPYDECTALLARHYAWTDQPSRLARLTAVLDRQLHANGGLGRDTLIYAFDTALCLPVAGAGRARALQTVLSCLEGRAAAQPVHTPERWSQAFGPHLLKAIAALRPEERSAGVLTAQRALVGECYADGAFRTHPDRLGTYLHAHCYAVEGLLALEGRSARVEAAVDWLAEQVQADGGLPAWVDAPVERRPSDVVAQAARLFALVAPRRHAGLLRRTLGRLAALQDPESGGIRYVEGGEHVNVWASIFAHQATRLGRAALGDTSAERHSGPVVAGVPALV